MLNQNQHLMFRICNLLQLHLKSIFYIFYISYYFFYFFYSYERYIKNLSVNVTSVTRLIFKLFLSVTPTVTKCNQ